MKPPAVDIDDYICQFPPGIREILTAVRATVRAAAPDAEERISYGMPAFFEDGAVVYFAAFKHHIGLFPPVEDPAVRAKVARYAGPKGNLQFPYSAPMPLDLIADVVRARLAANRTKAEAKRSKKNAPGRASKNAR
jgi:uncharacterized protein YdhG (YjbR/CyaY superfamily)